MIMIIMMLLITFWYWSSYD